jgi:hypothetical protein
MLTKDEPRQIAANVAKLPGLFAIRNKIPIEINDQVVFGRCLNRNWLLTY